MEQKLYQPHLMRTPIMPSHVNNIPEDPAAAAKTAQDILWRSGLDEVVVTEEEAQDAEQMFMDTISKVPNPTPHQQLMKPATALKLEALLSEYDYKVVQHAEQIRHIVTNKLLELSDSKDLKVQIKAVELLGKIADVGMFVEKQEITYKEQSTDALERKLKERLGLLIEGEVVGEKMEILPYAEARTAKDIEDKPPVIAQLAPEAMVEVKI